MPLPKDSTLQNIFNWLTADIENLYSKPWLKTAIACHMKNQKELKAFSENEIKEFVNTAFLNG